MNDYKNLIGDGKTPNIYYVFQFDEIAARDKDGIKFPDKEAEGGLIGEFKTYKKALECVDNKAYLPHVFIEDRLSGMIFEQYQVDCKCCGHSEYETNDDSKFTRETLGNLFE
jgi:hypothetical protein